MKASHRLLGLLLIALVAAVGLALRPGGAEAGGGIFVVNTTTDTDDGTCDPAHCSLREAILITNALGGPQDIEFDIPVSGIARIRLCRPLPIISDVGTRIDGTTQPGYSGSPLIILEPRYTPSDLILSTPWGPPPCVSTTVGLWIEADSTVVTGLSLVGFNSGLSGYTPAAIVVNTGTSNTIQDNYLGIEPNGTIRPNRRGIMLGSSGQIVRNNVISGNEVGIYAAAPNQTIQGNHIGTDPTGQYSLGITPNTTGIQLRPAASNTLIGGTNPGDGNVISGASQNGIWIQSNANFVQGNIIGANAQGDNPIPNLDGIRVEGRFNLIGGTSPGAGNLISGNLGRGIYLHDTGSLQGNNTVQGNLIGVTSAGSTSLGNGTGVWNDAGDSLIGGSAAGAGNTISGNRGSGIELNSGTHNRIQGNQIGTDPSGTVAVPNRVGIRTGEAVDLNGIGGSSPGMGNLIAYNRMYGVHLRGPGINVFNNVIRDNEWFGIHVEDLGSSGSSIRHWIRMNEIYSNGLLGIDLQGGSEVNYVTQNDPGDTDSGPNTLLNFPVLGSSSGGQVTGTACINCTVDIYLSDHDPSGHGEGQLHVGSGVANSSGTFQVSISAPPPIAPCTRLTATASDSFGNTSEFAADRAYGWCFVLDLPIWVAVIVFPWLVGGLGGWVIGRRRPRPLRPIAVGTGIGAIVGLGLGLGAFLLPSIEIPFPEGEAPQPVSAPEAEPVCSDYFDPQAFSPPDGAVFETYDDPLLEWALLATAPESLGPFQVELLGPYGMLMNEVTEAMSLPFSTFGLLPEPGSLYAWRVVPVEIDDAGRPEGQCEPGRWMTFQMGEAEDPGPPPWIPEYVPEPLPEEPTEPEQTCDETTVVITALQNLNCREGTSQAFEIRGTLFEGAQATVLAFNPLKTWAFIENPSSPGSYCWIWMGQAEVTEGDPECAPIRRDPEPPAPACTRELPRDQCAAAGGTWVQSAAAASYCSCPTP